MPRNMSFSLTTEQIRNRTKTVTRRRGWKFLKPGDLLNACVKCMGLKPGEQVEKLAVVRVVMVTQEELQVCTDSDAAREGFPKMTGAEFVEMFCRHMGGKPSQIVRRIEFEYVDDVPGEK
jgi:hypothetical protein